MKYTYAYKTSDGKRHEASMDAESREAVFSALREKGIKAIKVVAADGSKANGEIRGIRKRVFAASIIAVAVLVAAVSYFIGARTDEEKPEIVKTDKGIIIRNPALPLTRQEIPGSRPRIEKLPPDLFKHRADAFLARFAEPGRPFSAPEIDWPSKADFEACFKESLKYTDDELTEYIDLKRIVTGMKHEMRAYLVGGGLISGYIRELIKRQELEASYREKADKKLDELLKAAANGTKKDYRKAYDHWLQSNAFLKSIGVFGIPLPPALREYQLNLGNED